MPPLDQLRDAKSEKKDVANSPAKDLLPYATIHLIFGGLLGVLGAAVFLGTFVILARVATDSSFRAHAPTGAIPVLLVVSMVAIGITYYGHKRWTHGRKIAASKRATTLIAKDTRPPVVYLRSFGDDAIASEVQDALDPILTIAGAPVLMFFPGKTEEEQTVKVLSGIGPVVAIGKPGEPLPELGAIRKYATDDEWQGKVKDWLSRARLVVFRAGVTHGLTWEVQQAVSCLKPEQIMFLIPENLNYGAFTHIFKDSLPWELPHLPAKRLKCGSLAGVVYFDTEGRGHFTAPQRLIVRQSLRNPVVSQMTMMLKPVFQNLKVPWKRPQFGFLFWCCVLLLTMITVPFGIGGVSLFISGAHESRMKNQVVGEWNLDVQHRLTQMVRLQTGGSVDDKDLTQRVDELLKVAPEIVPHLQLSFSPDGVVQLTTANTGGNELSQRGRWTVEEDEHNKLRITVNWEHKSDRKSTETYKLIHPDTLIPESRGQMQTRFIRPKGTVP